jgi:hypothetical protein
VEFGTLKKIQLDGSQKTDGIQTYETTVKNENKTYNIINLMPDAANYHL